jgi:SAM-dependent methyltransferase
MPKVHKSINPSDKTALEISGADNVLWQSIGFKSYRATPYPGFDICQEALKEQFDVIIADQIFEHLLWPYRAARNAYAMLKPGGYLIIATPFLVRRHNLPTDCTRWTDVGIRYFLAEAGFSLERVQTGPWGNKACLKDV